MLLKIAVMNLQSGIGVTKGYREYLTRGWRYWLGHSGKPVGTAAMMLAEEAPDIVLVSEVDEPSRRSRFTSHIEILQQSTRLPHAKFFSTKSIGNTIQEGSAILSTFPLHDTQAHPLRAGFNPRVLGRASVHVDGRSVTLFVAHVALGSKTRAKQISEIAEIIRNTPGPIILGGDFNERKELLLTLFSAVGLSAVTIASYPSWRPKYSLQALFLSSHFVVKQYYQPTSAVFSDHLPLIAEVEFEK